MNSDPLGRGIQTYRGTQDFYGDEARWRLRAVEVVRTSFEQFGFEPLETPVIENERTLKGKYGQEGEMKRFRLSLVIPEEAGLRYDHTVPLARFMAMYWNAFPLPYRRYVIGPVFRHESPQAGRLRQFTQCDFDTVGSSSPVIDAEIVAMNYTVLTRLGFRGNFSVRLNDRRLLNAMARSLGVEKQEQILAVFRGWDKLEKANRENVREELEEVGIEKELIQNFDSVTDKLLSLSGQKADAVLSGIAKIFPTKGVKDAIANIEQIVGFIASMSIPEDAYRIWPLLARGLDYYTGPIFETVVETAGIGSITGGGRFDNLITQMGGPDMPASGSSFGLERVMGVMEQLGLKPQSSQSTAVFVTLFDVSSRELCKSSFEVATALRLKGYPVEVYTGEISKLSRQLEIADKKSIPLAIILGPDELRQKAVSIKDLRQGKGDTKQVTVPVEQVVSQVETILK